MIKKITHSVKETQDLAKGLATTFKGGEIIGLSGDLGAGKTAFVQGLAKSLGIRKKINSPTFILMKIYPIKNKRIKNFLHLDAYRLNDWRELIDIGISDYLNKPDTLIAVEWVEKVKEIKKYPAYKEIKIGFTKKINERIISFK